MNNYCRINYFHKVKKLTADIQQQIILADVKLIHAHTIFSDGGIALKLKKKYGIPYIVAVRSTDINIFFKYLFYLRKCGIRILEEAENIIFLNPDLQNELYKKYITPKIAEKLAQKSLCIPNGISDFWHNRKGIPKQISKNALHLLYVGTFLRRKNVPLIIEAASLLSKYINVSLTIVGGGGKGTKEVMEALKSFERKGEINMVGKVNNLEELKQYYSKADIFVMPSKNETFGLVYIEAISQGTPVIYVKNTGISGYFNDGEIGYGITNFSATEIAEKIKLVRKNYSKVSESGLAAIDSFNWQVIAGKYIDIYEEILKHKLISPSTLPEP